MQVLGSFFVFFCYSPPRVKISTSQLTNVTVAATALADQWTPFARSPEVEKVHTDSNPILIFQSVLCTYVSHNPEGYQIASSFLCSHLCAFITFLLEFSPSLQLLYHLHLVSCYFINDPSFPNLTYPHQQHPPTTHSHTHPAVSFAQQNQQSSKPLPSITISESEFSFTDFLRCLQPPSPPPSLPF